MALARDDLTKFGRALVSPSAVAGLVVLIGGIAVTVVGLADVPAPWMISGTGALIIAGYLAGRALELEATDAENLRLLWGTVGGLVVFIVGAWSYHAWWDPSEQVRPQ